MNSNSRRNACSALVVLCSAVLASSGYADERNNGVGPLEEGTPANDRFFFKWAGVKPLYESAPPIGYVDCFWGEPFFYGGKLFYDSGYAGSLNANIDDVSATYWATRVRLEFGDRLILRGQFGHNRYASIQSYGVTDPTSSLRDNEIIPDEGSSNPYLQGSYRATPMDERWFTITVLNEDPPEDDADRAPNTLYARPPETDPDRTQVDLRWRSYFVDEKYDVQYDNRGGGQLPFPIGIIRAGSDVVEPFQCDRDPKEQTLQLARHFTNSQAPQRYWRGLWESYPCSEAAEGAFCNDPWTAPARNPPVFEKFFSVPYSEQGLFIPPQDREALKPPSNCNQVGAPGIPANFDANYGSAYVSDEFGKVIRITARHAKTPKTYWNTPFWDEFGTDMRYWSWTVGNERVTGNIVDGVSDQQIPILDDGTYSVVVSLPENRPASATQKCGHAWANWGRHGDGSGRWGVTTLVLRNIVPSEHFQNALQNVCEAGTEAQVMGEYYPVIEYFDDAETFDREVGCLQTAPELGSN